MNKRPQGENSRAQTFLEYLMLFGIVTALVVAMSPMIRRFTQAMVKFTADQVGVQQMSDQKGGESSGYLVNAYARAYGTSHEGRSDHLGITTYYPGSSSQTGSEQYSNLGITRE